MSINLEGLLVEIPYKWRVQSFSKYNNSCSCVAYIDARDAMDLLDKIVGPMNWQSDYREIRGNLYAGVAIFDQEKKEWVWKWDCGIESQTEKEKGEASDSFKRACVKWGIGRFLYSIDIQYLLSDKPKTDKNVFPIVVDENGKKIKDITTYINNKLTTKKAQDSYKKAESQNIQKDQKKPEIAKNQLKQDILTTPTPAKEVSKVTNIDRQFDMDKCNDKLLTFKYIDQVRLLKQEVKKYYGEKVFNNSEVQAMFRTYENLPEAPVDKVVGG